MKDSKPTTSGPVEVGTPSPGVAEISMASPPVNQFSVELLEALDAAVASLPASTTAVVVTSQLDGIYAAGGDVTYMAAADLNESRAYVDLVQRVSQVFEQPEIISIAAIDGSCLGGGLELALACDIRMVTPGAVLGLPEATLGILASGGGIHRLVRAVGQGVARDMLLTGSRLSGADAHRWGLASRLVDGDVAGAARELAVTLAAYSPEAMAATKRLALRASTDGLEEGLRAEAESWIDVRAGANAQEGLSAFAEKRQPRFVRPRP